MEFATFPQSHSLPVKMISFVSPSNEISGDHVKYKSTFEPNLSGTEVRNFYNSVISLPSEHRNVKKPSNYLKKPEESKKSACSSVNTVKSNSIFLYAQQGNVVGIQQCIENGCSINQQDAYGWTPIMCASCEGHYSTVEYLIKLGADLNVKCKHGLTVMDIVRKTQNSAIITLLQNGVSLHEQETSSIIPDEKNDKEEKFCNDCKSTYKVSKSAHERSIAHLLTTTKSDISTFYHIPENNKGFQMMLKSGWDKNKGLGMNADGRKFPIKTVFKKDRSCIGKNKEVPKVTHFNANDEASIKMRHHKALRIIREKTFSKQERKKLEARDRQREIRFRRLFNT
ncbi:ANK_REP_REGION domain-containing protein [Trichonephila clavata]|uniref:ANK_REP_REGION domain-containing protein n=1 Tax=Trichonephila clavata TaxID=2740835 RepID=A0A8X6GWE7_TRICU|nr:ANK_REP_REGION domain-containing protein [Trichonephila clavata]